MKLASLRKLPENKQGIVIDILVIVINLFLFPFYAERLTRIFADSLAGKNPDPRTLGTLMIVLLVGRLGGLYLKRFPLQARMRSAEAAFSAYFLVFSAPIMILTAIGGAIAIQAFAAGFGWMETGADGVPNESRLMTMVVVFSVLFLAGVEIYLMSRLGKRLGSEESAMAAKGSWLYTGAGEFVADFGLFAYMMVWQVVYYLVAGVLLTPAEGHSFDTGTRIFGVFIVAICFGLFYISPRAVFLTEDRKYLSTWVLIFAAFISSLLPHWLQKITEIFF